MTQDLPPFMVQVLYDLAPAGNGGKIRHRAIVYRFYNGEQKPISNLNGHTSLRQARVRLASGAVSSDAIVLLEEVASEVDQVFEQRAPRLASLIMSSPRIQLFGAAGPSIKGISINLEVRYEQSTPRSAQALEAELSLLGHFSNGRSWTLAHARRIWKEGSVIWQPGSAVREPLRVVAMPQIKDRTVHTLALNVVRIARPRVEVLLDVLPENCTT